LLVMWVQRSRHPHPGCQSLLKSWYAGHSRQESNRKAYHRSRTSAKRGQLLGSTGVPSGNSSARSDPAAAEAAARAGHARKSLRLWQQREPTPNTGSLAGKSQPELGDTPMLRDQRQDRTVAATSHGISCRRQQARYDVVGNEHRDGALHDSARGGHPNASGTP